MSPCAQTTHSNVSKVQPLFVLFNRHIALLNIASLVFVILLVAFYIVQVNNTATKGYNIRELETQIKELTMQNQRLDVEARKVQALENVSNSVKMLGLIQAETPSYVMGGAPSYALAK